MSIADIAAAGLVIELSLPLAVDNDVAATVVDDDTAVCCYCYRRCPFTLILLAFGRSANVGDPR